jgi:hypothetical protein
LRDRELEVLGWTTDDESGEIALLCRLVDGSAGDIPARWTDLPVRVESQRAVGGFGSPAGWRLLLARGERLGEQRPGDRLRTMAWRILVDVATPTRFWRLQCETEDGRRPAVFRPRSSCGMCG